MAVKVVLEGGCQQEGVRVSGFCLLTFPHCILMTLYIGDSNITFLYLSCIRFMRHFANQSVDPSTNRHQLFDKSRHPFIH